MTQENPSGVINHNQRAWNRMVSKKQRFTKPADEKDLRDPLATVDGAGWLGNSIAGKSVLCLAAGGGRQGIIYASAGANVSVVDISGAMLELDRQVAAEKQLSIRTFETSMDDLPMFQDGEFEIVIHPVSTCYLPEIQPVFNEVARVTAPGGIYISQHKQPTSMQSDVQPSANGYEITEPYYRSGPLPEVIGSSHREAGTMEFVHRWEEIIGGMCRAGFVIEDLVEPVHADESAPKGTFNHRSCYIAPYVRIKARRYAKLNNKPTSKPTSKLILE